MSIKTVRYPGMVEIKDPANGGRIEVPEHHNMVCILGSGGSDETRNMPIPKFPGQTCTLACNVHGGGNIVVNVAGDGNTQGHDEVTFTAAGQAVHFIGAISGGALRWRAAVADPSSILA